MKRTIVPGDTPSAWSAQALYDKAQRYVQQMAALDSDGWEYALWSSLSLELLARAALANVSPALLAEHGGVNANSPKWSNLYHSLGFQPLDEKFSPRSIAISEVFKRLGGILSTELPKELENFGIEHTGRRNAELHSGELAFEGLKLSVWQPKYYRICHVLLNSMGISAADYFGEEEAEAAAKVMAAYADESAKAVLGDVDAHKKAWADVVPMAKAAQAAIATNWALRHIGHRVECPACGSTALVKGEPVAPPIIRVANGDVTETQDYLPDKFECVACGLKISGLSKLAVVKLADRYKHKSNFDASAYYAVHDEYQDFDDDNNER